MLLGWGFILSVLIVCRSGAEGGEGRAQQRMAAEAWSEQPGAEWNAGMMPNSRRI
ncbi:MAG: hypothetical protein KDC85_00525 [Saprospiraceae bacterium]|nr:hypothetical protein [Saprospiraceae bacterium]MCB9326084.1 hypothetical protein [Lewinellaceae bacterium]